MTKVKSIGSYLETAFMLALGLIALAGILRVIYVTL